MKKRKLLLILTSLLMIILATNMIQAVEVNKCSLLSNQVKEKIKQQVSLGNSVVLKEGDPALNSQYIVVPAGNGGYILKIHIQNSSTSDPNNDKVIFTNVLDSGDAFTSSQYSEGIGSVVIGGISYQVRYYANDYSNQDTWNITLNWLPLEDIDTFYNCEPKWGCTDSDVDSTHPEGKNYYMGGQLTFEKNSTYTGDKCMNTSYLREYYCDANNESNYEDYLCPNGCEQGACRLNPRPNCTEKWKCDEDWSECTKNRTKSIDCIDLNNCSIMNKKTETQICTYLCNPNWECTSWVPCINGKQSRICVDMNYCGVESNKPVLSKDCNKDVCDVKIKGYIYNETKNECVYIDRYDCGYTLVYQGIEECIGLNNKTVITENYTIIINGKIITFEKITDNKYIIRYNNNSIETMMEPVKDKRDLYIKTSSGSIKKLNHLPELEELKDISKKTIIENIEKREITEKDGEAIYLVTGTKKARLFFIFPIKAKVIEKYNIVSGEFVETNRPWWSFLASGI